MIIKLDLEKAYDRLEWGFIQKVLQFFEFLEETIQLVLNCISSASTSILVNGGWLKRFASSRGLRQGNPIAPCIFILCLEFLSFLIHKGTDEG